MNILQKMAYEVLTGTMEVSLFMTDDEIKEKVKEMGNNDVLREFFRDYSTGELLDIIEQTMESDC